MPILFAIIGAEVLFFVCFPKQSALFHGALLLVTCKVIVPILWLIAVHVFWRIPNTIIHKRFRSTMAMHTKMWFGVSDKYSAPKHRRTIFNSAMPTIDEYTLDIINPNGKPADLDKELEILVKQEGGRNG